MDEPATAGTSERHPDDLPPDAARRRVPRGLLWALALAVVVLTIASWVALGAENGSKVADPTVVRLGDPDVGPPTGGLDGGIDIVGKSAPMTAFETFTAGRSAS